MQYHFYTVTDEHIDQQVLAYLRLKQQAAKEHEASGRSNEFTLLVSQVTHAYAKLTECIGLTHAYLKYKSDFVRSLKVERSCGRTMLAVPKPLRASSDGLEEISESQYISMRQESMKSLGMLPQVMMNAASKATVDLGP